MGVIFRIIPLLVALTVAAGAIAEPIVYQGQLQDNGGPYNGTVDMNFTLYDSEVSDSAIASVSASNVAVTDGLFQVTLDFGDVPYDSGLWLEIAVDGQTLSGRQPIRAAPLAIRTLESSGGTTGDSVWSVSGSTAYYDQGFVGVGTAGPNAPLHVNGDGTSPALFRVQRTGSSKLTVASNGGVSVGLFDDTPPSNGLRVRGNLEADSNVSADGEIRINADASDNLSYLRFRDQTGTSGPRIYHRQSDNEFHMVGMSTIRAFSDFSVGGRMLGDVNINGDISVNSNASSNLSYIRFRGTSGTSVPRIYHRQTDNQIHFAGMDVVRVFGTMRSDIVEIAGADIAEEFPFSEPVEPGDLVAIDPDNPGMLRRATAEYDTAVAGIIPGANEFSTGMVLGRGSGNEHAAPVALSGRVYVRAVGVEPIRPGDFLTSSDKPGHARRASDTARRGGAVIGKAMSALAAGESGLVLVLVNLQ